MSVTTATARQIPLMVQHIDDCDVCGDDDIRADVRREDLPAEEIPLYILLAHTSRI